MFISNEDVDAIFKISKSLKDSEVMIDGVSEAVIHEIISKKVDLLLL